MAVFSGTNNSDSILGTADDDTITGGNGDDTLLGSGGNDQIEGGADNDILQGGTGDDTLTGDAGDDTLYGGTGDDVLSASGGGDRYVIEAGWGDDTITAFDSASDSIDMAATGLDFTDLAITQQASDVLITDDNGNSILVNNANADDFDAAALNVPEGSAFGATEGDDSITGTNADDSIDALGGNDTVSGGGGNDTLLGGNGDDLLDGVWGNNQVFGGGGNDTVVVGFDDETLSGGAGSDLLQLMGHVATNVDLDAGELTMSAAQQTLILGFENIKGSDRNDTIAGDDAGNTLWGGNGDDLLTGGAGDDLVSGGAGNDTIVAEAGVDTLQGGSGVNVLQILSSLQTGVSVDLADGTLDGLASAGRETVIEDFQIVTGAGGNDTIIGNDAGNTLRGGNGDDLLAGGEGDDLIGGGTGNDTVVAGLGADTLQGGSGVNVLQILSSLQTGVSVDLASGTLGGLDTAGRDTSIEEFQIVTGALGADTIAGDAAANTLSGGHGDDVITGGNGDDLLEGGAGNDELSGGAGNDTLISVAGADTLKGGAGDDVLSATSGSDHYVFGAGWGNDTITAYLSSDDIDMSATGLEFTDLTVTQQASDVLISDGSGNSILVNNANADSFDAAALNLPEGNTDTSGPTEGDDSLVGTDGDDTIDALGGDDTVRGGNGDDLLAGGYGDDIVSGGAGNDTIVADTGADTLQGGSGINVLQVLSSLQTGVSVDLDASTVGGLDSTGRDTAIEDFQIVVGGGGDDTITGDDTGNTLSGGAGDDTVRGGNGDDVLLGGAGDDLVSGGAGNDTVIADSGVDTLQGGAGVNLLQVLSTLQTGVSVDLGDGSLEGLASAGRETAIEDFQIVTGASGDDTLTGDDAGNTLSGLGGNDIIRAGNGDDLLEGGTGNDLVSGGGGNDTIVADTGVDTLQGGAGVNVLQILAGLQTGVSVDLGDGTIDGLASAGRETAIEDFQIVVGADGDDTISGDDSANTLSGAAGEDNITGARGADLINGGAGNDTLMGGDGNDVLSGGNGDDSIDGGHDDDTVVGGAGNDVLDGRYANDLVLGGAGDDTLSESASGQDTLDGGAGNDLLESWGGDDVYLFSAGWGNDTIYVFEEGRDRIDMSATGLDFADLTITRENVQHVLITDGDGNSILVRNVEVEAFDSVSLNIPGGGVVLNGTAADDSLAGSGGDDTISGLDGTDTLSGGAGRDLLRGDTGNDLLAGGAGVDTFQYEAGWGSDTVADFDADQDRFDMSATGLVFSDLTITQQSSDVLITDGNGNSILVVGASTDDLDAVALNVPGPGRVLTGTESWDSLVGTDKDDTIDGLGRADTLRGGAGNDLADGGPGGDWMYGDTGDDTMIGGEGNDFVFGGTGADVLQGGDGRDRLTGNEDNDRIFGGAGNDSVVGHDGDDTLDGGAGNDSVVGHDGADLLDGGDGNDTVEGNDGDDTLRGGNGDDLVYGFDDDDLLDGGLGNDVVAGHDGDDTIMATGGDDTLVGLADSDTFRIMADWGNDLINDYSSSHDTIDMSNTGLLFSDLTITQQGGSVLISDGQGNSLLVRSSSAHHFDAETLNLQVSGGEASENADSLVGADGDDTIDALGGDDTVRGGNGDDSLSGGEGNDLLAGDAGDDLLSGGNGEDSITGGDGNDTIVASNGDDTLRGGNGDDVFAVTNARDLEDDDRTYGGDGNDIISFADAPEGVNFGFSSLYESIEEVHGSDGDDTLWGGSHIQYHLRIDGGEGDDVILTGVTATQSLRGGNGDDHIRLSGTDYFLSIGASGGAGNDTFEFWAFNESVVWDLTSTTSLSSIHLYEFENIISAEADDTLRGDAGANRLQSNGGEDLLEGRGGDDTLVGGRHDDTLVGGAGADTFVFDASWGDDVITDYNGDEDLIDMSALEIPFTEISVVQADADVVISDDNGNSVIVMNANANDFDATSLNVPEGTPGTANAIEGTDAAERIEGTAGRDIIRSYDGQDTVYGGRGNDTIFTGSSSDRDFARGEEGNDLIIGGTAQLTARGGDGDDTIWGNDDRDSLYGNDGDDSLVGGGCHDRLTGDDGDDTLRGGEGNDTLSGNEGADLIDGGNGIDVWAASTSNGSGAGSNVNLATGLAFGHEAEGDTLVGIEGLRGSSTDDTLTGDGGPNGLLGRSGDDVLTGAGGNDTLTGSSGNDTLFGGEGNDMLSGGFGEDQFLFGAGWGDDTVTDFDANEDSIDMSGTGLAFDELTVSQQGADVLIADGSGNSILVNNANADEFDAAALNVPTGGVGATENADSLLGTDGNDTIDALGGDDTVSGGNGDDALSGGEGNDLLAGDDGDDLLSGGNGEDSIIGGDGNDTIVASNGYDTMRGGNGDDIFTVQDRSEIATERLDGNRIDGGAGHDVISFAGAPEGTTIYPSSRFQSIEEIIGTAGDDTIYAGGVDVYGQIVRGGDGNDVIHNGSNNHDYLFGGKGDDLILFSTDWHVLSLSADGGEGNDTFAFLSSHHAITWDLDGSGRSSFFTLSSFENLWGSHFGDTLSGDEDDNSLVGWDGGDLLSGRDGDDTLRGERDNDTLRGGNGDDSLSGGTGDDVLDGGAGNDTLVGGDGNDTINGAGGAGADLVRGEDGDDVIFVSDDATVSGGNGDDDIAGGAGDESLSGDLGDDTLWGDAGDDTLSGGVGNDVLEGRENADIVLGGAGDDNVFGGAGDDSLAGDAGSDYMLGGTGRDTVSGGENNDTVRGGDDDDLIAGDAGNDYLAGNGDSDTISGGDGADRIDGGTGRDMLSGGAGADTFEFAGGWGHDTITDFDGANGDSVDLSATGLAFDELTVSQQGGDVLIEDASGNSIYIRNATASDFDADALNVQDASGTTIAGILGITDPWTALPDAGTQPDIPAVGGDLISGTLTMPSGAVKFVQNEDSAIAFHDSGLTYLNNDGLIWRETDRASGGAVDGARTTLNNSGDIVSLVELTRAVGVRFLNEEGNFNNSGNIYAVSGVSRAIGIESFGSGDTVNLNSGTIHAWSNTTAYGLQLRATSNFTNSGDVIAEGQRVAIGVEAHYADEIINHGRIEAITDDSPDSHGIYLWAIGPADMTVINTGTIIAEQAVRVGYTGDLSLDNSGALLGDVVSSNGDDIITNSGEITGDVTLAEGDDTLNNTGDITGNIDLGDGDDLFDGSTGNVDGVVDGGDGNDTLRGSDGDDMLVGGAGMDWIEGRAGDDTLTGGDGTDFFGFDIAWGNDTITDFTDGEDKLVVGEGALAFLDAFGMTFDDLIVRQEGDNTFVSAGAGHHILLLDFNADNFDADDIIPVGITEGTPGNDTINGDDGLDYVLAGAGDDRVTTGSGNDLINGGDGNDTLDGGANNDSIDGGDGDDRISGGAGDDTLTGGAGADGFLFGLNWGNDTITDFEDGVDKLLIDDNALTVLTLLGYSIEDLIIRQEGDDTFISAGAGHHILLKDFNADDISDDDILPASGLQQGTDADEILTGTGGTDFIEAAGGDDRVMGQGGSDFLFGGNGDDSIDGGADADRLSGGAGNDTLQGGAGNDTLTGGSGADVYHFNHDGSTDTITDFEVGDSIIFAGDIDYTISQQGDDVHVQMASGVVTSTLIISNTDIGDAEAALSGNQDGERIRGSNRAETDLGTNADDTIDGRRGDDTIISGAGDDNILGGDDNDVIRGGTGNDRLNGEEDNDLLYGDRGDDTLEGDSGHDTLIGGEGNDLIDAGSGNDTVSAGAGDDRIEADSGVNRLGAGDGDDSVEAGGATTVFAGAGDDHITVSGDATVFGGADNDNIRGGATSALQAYGGTGTDQISGGLGDDYLSGGEGNDTLYGGLGSDSIIGGNGDDLLGLVAPVGTSGGFNVDLQSAELTFSGNTSQIDGFENVAAATGAQSRNDTLRGDDEANRLEGGGCNDVLEGRGGDDTLAGGANADTFVFGGTWGDDTISDYEAGTDIIDLSATLITADSISLTKVTGGTLLEDGSGNSILFSGIDPDEIDTGDFLFSRIVNGSGNDDTLAGDDQNNDIWGGEGNDDIDAGDGADNVLGGDGDDTIDGGAGDDTLDGGVGNDLITGGDGADLVMAGCGDDTVQAIFVEVESGASGMRLEMAVEGASARQEAAVFDTSVTAPQVTLGEGLSYSYEGGRDAAGIPLSEGKDSGQWYWEVTIDDISRGGKDLYVAIGAPENSDWTKDIAEIDGALTLRGDGRTYIGDGRSADRDLRNERSFGEGDVIGVAYNADTGAIWISVNGQWWNGATLDEIASGDTSGAVMTGLTEAYVPTAGGYEDSSSGGHVATIVVDEAAFAQTPPTGFAAFDSNSGGAIGDAGDTLDGGDGTDWIDLSNAPEGVNMGEVRLENTGDSEIAGDIYRNFENIRGSACHDLLSGGNGDNAIDGGDGNDTLDGGADNDTLIGGNGDDVFVAPDAGDVLDGGEGFDVVSFADSTSATITVSQSHSSIEQYVGSGGDDTFAGSDAADHLIGGDGNDFFTGGNGDDTLDGGAGIDGIQFVDSDDLVNLATGVAQHDGMTVTLVGIENVHANAGDDTLIGSDEDNVMLGGSGHDQLSGGNGEDSLLGGANDDTLEGGAGEDTLEGGDGNDTFVIEAGFTDDVIADFTIGDDIIDLSQIPTTFSSLVFSQVGDDTEITVPDHGILVLEGVTAADLSSSDFFMGDTDLEGTENNDLIEGVFRDETLAGLAGDDTLRGEGGNDTLLGGEGNDLLSGGDGADVILGGNGDDTIEAYAGAAPAGDIEIEDASGASQVTVDGLSYTYEGGRDAEGVALSEDLASGRWYWEITIDDTSRGGKDLFVGIAAPADSDWTEILGEIDGSLMIRGDGRSYEGDGRDAERELRNERGFGDGDVIGVAFDADTGAIWISVNGQWWNGATLEEIASGDTSGAVMTGITEAYVPTAGGYDNSTSAGHEATFVVDASGFSHTAPTGFAAYGTAGAPAATGGDTVDGGAGHDVLDLSALTYAVDMSEGDGRQIAGGNYDNIEGLIGTDQDDYLERDGVDGSLRGGNGDDTLEGGSGADTLTGGAGTDVFKIGAGFGADVVTDFVSGTDKIDLSGSGYDYFDVVNGLTSASGDAVWDAGDGHQITFDGVAPGGVSVADFVFGGNVILGTDSDDTVTGGADADYLIGLDGDDSLFGGAGDDTLIGGNGDDTLDGDAGHDLMLGTDAGDRVDLAAGSATLGGGAGTDVLIGIEAVSAGNGDDTLIGSADGDSLSGGAGNDALAGGEGNDTLSGGTGDDRFTYGDGWGADQITDFTDGEDILDFSASTLSFADLTITNVSGNATVSDGNGNSVTLVGVDASSIDETDFSFGDTITGTANDDDLSSGLGRAQLEGLEGDDTLTGGSLGDTLDGGEGNDLLSGGDGADVILGGNGDDTIEAYAGAAPAGDIEIEDASGASQVTVDGLSYTYEGGRDAEGVALSEDLASGRWYWEITIDDTSRGGKDLFVGIAAPADSDWTEILGEIDGSLMIRGDGRSYEGDGRDAERELRNERGFGDGDVIGVAFDADTGAIWISVNGQWWNGATLEEIASGDTSGAVMTGITEAYAPTAGGYDNSTSAGHEATFVVDASGFSHTVPTGFAAYGTAGAPAATGGDTVDGGAGHDVLDLSALTYAVDMSEGDGRQIAGGNYDNIEGLIGTDQDDYLERDGVDGSLRGGNGDDTLEGGSGADTLTGGAGTDVFKIGAGFGADVITDFASGTDKIDLSGSGYDYFDVVNGLTSASGDAVWDAGDGHQITFDGVALGGVSVADFVFGGNVILGTDSADTVTGGTGADYLIGLDGNDSLFGGAGDDTLIGGNGDDTLDGDAGHDLMLGTDAGDRVDLAAGSATLGGGAGTDVLIGIEAVSAGNGDDTLIGSADGDSLSGGAGNDALAGGEGNDTLSGGTGDDRFTYGDGWGADQITDFTDGEDILDFSASTLSFADLTITNVSGNATVSDGNGNSVTLVGVDASSIDETDFSFGDTITGTANDDDLSSGLGRAQLEGLEGDDTLTGGSLGDTLLGGEGNDLLSGGDGADVILGGNGDDTIEAYAGAAPAGDIEIEDASGASQVTVDGLSYTYEGGRDAEGVALSEDLASGRWYWEITIDDTSRGGKDLFVGIAAPADSDWTEILGEIDGSLMIRGDGRSYEGDGRDAERELRNERGFGDGDVIGVAFDADTGAIWISVNGQWWNGATLEEIASGDTSGAVMTGITEAYAPTAGGYDNSTSAGHEATFVIDASGFSHTVPTGFAAYGTAGAPAATGGDTVDGGAGHDVLDLSGLTSGVDMADAALIDAGGALIGGNNYRSIEEIVGTAQSDALNAGTGNETLSGNNGDDTLAGLEGNDSITGGNGGDLLDGGEGDDTLSGGAGNDTLTLGAGDDDLTGGAGDDIYVLSAGFGNDTVSDFEVGVDKIDLGDTGLDYFDVVGGLVDVGGVAAFDDGNGNVLVFEGLSNGDVGASDFIFTGNVVAGTDSADTLVGSSCDDYMVGGDGADSLTADDGDDTLLGGAGNDTLEGEGGADSLDGGLGRDILDGGDGDDTLASAAGNDTLTGDRGADRFVVTDDSDGSIRIADFDVSEDILDISGMVASGSFLDIAEETTSGGVAGVMFTFDFGGSVFLEDVRLGDLVEANILFEGETTLDPVVEGDKIRDNNRSNDIDGTAGDDTIDGRRGDDTITGGAGDDILEGDRDDDLFIFATGSGNDVIIDFNVADDTLDLQASTATFNSLSDILDASVETRRDGEDGTLIDLGDGDSLFLEDVSLGELAQAMITGSGGTVLDSTGTDDTLRATNSADTFVFAGDHGNDVVEDFDISEDRIDLTGASDLTGPLNNYATETTIGRTAGVLVDTGNGNTVFIEDITLGEFSLVVID